MTKHLFEKGNKINTGRKHTQEWKDKMSEFMKKNLPIKSFKKGVSSWNKGIEWIERRSDKHHNWKGDEVGYRCLHLWVTRRLGTPKCCDECGDTTKHRYHWHNTDGKYRRNLLDWKRLCPKCHKMYHNKGGNKK